MNVIKIDYGLILIFFISNYTYAELEHTESEYWWESLTFGVSNYIPWNWLYDNSTVRRIIVLITVAILN